MILPGCKRILAVCLLILAVSDKVLSKVEKRKTGQNWYDKDKWLESDAVFIDSGDGSSRKLSDGSGAGVVESDMWDGSGFGPDDEDADMEGSGDVRDTIEEGSGDVFIEERLPTTTKATDFKVQPRPTKWVELSPTTLRPETTKSTTTQPPVEVVEIDNQLPDETPSEPKSQPQPDPNNNMVPTQPTIYDNPTEQKRTLDPFLRPGILAAVIGGAVVGLLAAILLVMFIVYRMRKKDEGSYALDEPKAPPSYPYAYQKAPTKEFYA